MNLKRKTPLRPMSKRREKEGREYSKLRKEFLALRPICEAHYLVSTEDGVWTEDGGKIYNAEATDVHHTEGRYSGNYLRKETWLPVCRDCHIWIGNNPKEAEKLGLLSADRNRSIDRPRSGV